MSFPVGSGAFAAMVAGGVMSCLSGCAMETETPTSERSQTISQSAAPTERASQFSLTPFSPCSQEAFARTAEELAALTDVSIYLPSTTAPKSLRLCNGLPRVSYGPIELDLIEAPWVPDMASQWAEMVKTKQGRLETIAGRDAFVSEAGTSGSSVTIVQIVLGQTMAMFAAGEEVAPGRVLELARSLSPDPIA